MSTVIKVENISKRYVLGEINRKMLYQELQSRWARFRGKEDPHSKIGEKSAKSGEFWALKDLSFEIKDGDIAAVIGRNGAGKSTLLKILSRITAPTTGRVLIKGRVASLLEVGTGFKPELTGRENVYLNGTILGMTNAEVAKKFDEIAAFSGVEKFIDTPVKRYSSGMQVRLGFAVAAHLDPEILIIDEVLAVGDAAFRQKCLVKIGDVANQGRTVLFVSHVMAAVENLCKTGLVLEDGQLRFQGSQTDAISHYMSSIAVADGSVAHRTDRKGSGEIRVTSVEFRDFDGRPLANVSSGQDVDVCLFYEKKRDLDVRRLTAVIRVFNQYEVPLFSQHNLLTGESFGDIPDRGAFICRIRRLPLPACACKLNFTIRAGATGGDMIDDLANALEFNVESADFFGHGMMPESSRGVMLMDGEWRVEPWTPAAAPKIGDAPKVGQTSCLP